MHHLQNTYRGYWNPTFCFTQFESISTTTKPENAVTPREIIRSANSRMHNIMPTVSLEVYPRKEEDLQLLWEWYRELPDTYYSGWTENPIFANADYVRDSPYNIPVDDLKEISEKREPFYEEFEKFFQLMQTRTPEALARIKRTNELAAQIIEQSKQPDSTFSQNMVEFIQLRGLLVDMRYAESEEAEKAAFEKLMDFADASQDKELWKNFVYEIGLPSIMSVDDSWTSRLLKYRKQFAERFEIKQLGLAA